MTTACADALQLRVPVYLDTEPYSYATTFVGERIVLALNPGYPALQIFTISNDIEQPACWTTFRLPELSDAFRYECMGLTASQWSFSQDEMITSTDLEHGVAVASIAVFRDGARRATLVENLDLVVCVGPLLAITQGVMRTRHEGDDDPVLSFEWSEWGPMYARFFEYPIASSSWGSVSGFRIARTWPIRGSGSGGVTGTCIHVHDFNPRTIARSLSVSPHPVQHASFESHTEERTSPHFQPTAHDLDTALPAIPVPPVFDVYTHVVTMPFTRYAATSAAYAEDIVCAMPYKLVSRSIPDTVDVICLDSDNVVLLVSSGRCCL